MIVDFRSGKVEVKLARSPSYHLLMPIGNFPGRRDARQDCVYSSQQNVQTLAKASESDGLER